MTRVSPCGEDYGVLIAERHAGALDGDRTARLEAHMKNCPDCRAWDRSLDDLVDSLRGASEQGPLLHPTPEQLAALVAGKLESGERRSLEEHLAQCGGCQSEWNVVTAWNPPESTAEKATLLSRSPGHWSWFGAGAGLAAAAALLLSVFLPGVDLVSSGSTTLRPTTPPIQVRGAHHRAAGDATSLAWPVDGADLTVSLTVEAAPGTPLRVQLVDVDGKSSIAAGDLVLSDPAGLIFFTLDVAAVPSAGGEFRVTNVESGESFSYPFRWVDAGRP